MATPSRLCENRRLNEKAHFSQTRKGAKAAKGRPPLWRHSILNGHQASIRTALFIYSFTYGVPKAFGGVARPIQPASTTIVRMYGII